MILGHYVNSTTWLETNNFYDNYGRLRYATGNNHLNTALDAQNNYYSYDFADHVLTDTTTHKPNAGRTYTIINRNTFDYLGRSISSYNKIDANAEKHISTNLYNYRGELVTKGLSQDNVAGIGLRYLQKTDFTYNTQGWLTDINGPLASGQYNGSNEDQMDVFYLKLNYDSGLTSVNGQSLTLDKSGNISQMLWQDRGGSQKGYFFDYDFLSRVSNSKYFDVPNGTSVGIYNGYYNEFLTYDLRGNINTLARYTYDSNSDGNIAIDNLNYTYAANSNVLNKIADGSGSSQGFNLNGASGSANYLYDLNGSMYKDPYKKLDFITYYYNNMPKDITVNLGTGNVNKIRFTYDASGMKLRKQVRILNENRIDQINVAKIVQFFVANTRWRSPSISVLRLDLINFYNTFKMVIPYSIQYDNGNTSTALQDYVRGVEYNNGTIEAIYHSDGRAVWNGSTWRYEFNVTDHLGNVRAVISDLDNDKILDFTGSSTTNEVVNSYTYYPFGMVFGNNTPANNTVTPDTKYQYNGKEFNSDLGLNLLDYGARWYDPAIGRFTSVDPLAEKMPGWNPFAYGFNNPLKFTDPTGMKPETVKPGSDAALSMIKNTLTKADAQYVRLDENGTIDKEYLNSNSSSSSNYQRLSQLVNDNQLFEVNIASGFKYKDADGNVQSTEFGSIFQGEPSESVFSPNTGEEGFFGVTQTPGKEEDKYNSVDGNVHITINESLSESGRAQNFAHEGFGHGYLYSKGEDHMHNPKNTPEGFKETNNALAKNIRESVQETRNNLKDRNN